MGQPAAVHKAGFPIPFSGHTYTDIKISEEDITLPQPLHPFHPRGDITFLTLVVSKPELASCLLGD